MENNEILGKKKLTYELEYEIKLNTDNKSSGISFIFKGKGNSEKKAMKGLVLTEKYIKKMKKLGYIVENCNIQKVGNDGN